MTTSLSKNHLLFAALAAFTAATTTASAMEVETRGDMLVPKDDPVKDNSSAAIRRQETVEVLLSTYGYGLGLYVSPNIILEGAYTGLSTDDETNQWKQGAYLHGKFFMGNSFYAYLGASGRESGPSSTPMHDPQNQQILGDLGIGNQWQWRHFTMGCDWVGVSLPVMTQVNMPDNNDDHDRLFASVHEPGNADWQVMRLYAGLTF